MWSFGLCGFDEYIEYAFTCKLDKRLCSWTVDSWVRNLLSQSNSRESSRLYYDLITIGNNFEAFFDKPDWVYGIHLFHRVYCRQIDQTNKQSLKSFDSYWLSNVITSMKSTSPSIPIRSRADLIRAHIFNWNKHECQFLIKPKHKKSKICEWTKFTLTPPFISLKIVHSSYSLFGVFFLFISFPHLMKMFFSLYHRRKAYTKKPTVNIAWDNQTKLLCIYCGKCITMKREKKAQTTRALKRKTKKRITS